MFKASAFFTQLPPGERKSLLASIREVRLRMRFDSQPAVHENLGDLILQLEHDHNDQTRIERAERECQPSKSP